MLPLRCNSFLRGSKTCTFVVFDAHATSRRFFGSEIKAKSIKYLHPGFPNESLSLESETLSSSLQDQQVLVQMLGSPVHRLDLNLYGMKDLSFPHVAGNEGVGVVKQVGSNVSELKRNDHVIITKSGLGTWRTHAVLSSSELMKIPSDIPVEYAATLSCPLTALRVLSDFVSLQSGDVVIQNGANGTVGTSLIQIAKTKGLKTINIIRDRPNANEVEKHLKSLGADFVVTESELRKSKFKETFSKLPKPKLAVNLTGGQSSTEMARVLENGGTLVTVGGIGLNDVTIPSGSFIFNDIEVVGFSLARWLLETPQSKKKEELDLLFSLIRNKQLKLSIERCEFSKFKEAILKTQQPFNPGKIVLTY